MSEEQTPFPRPEGEQATSFGWVAAMTERPSPFSPERIGRTAEVLNAIFGKITIAAVLGLCVVAGAALARIGG